MPIIHRVLKTKTERRIERGRGRERRGKKQLGREGYRQTDRQTEGGREREEERAGDSPDSLVASRR